MPDCIFRDIPRWVLHTFCNQDENGTYKSVRKYLIHLQIPLLILRDVEVQNSEEHCEALTFFHLMKEYLCVLERDLFLNQMVLVEVKHLEFLLEFVL